MNFIVEFVRERYVWIGVAIGAVFIINGIVSSTIVNQNKRKCDKACWLTGATSSRLVDSACVCGKFGKRYPLVEKRPGPALLADEAH